MKNIEETLQNGKIAHVHGSERTHTFTMLITIQSSLQALGITHQNTIDFHHKNGKKKSKYPNTHMKPVKIQKSQTKPR